MATFLPFSLEKPFPSMDKGSHLKPLSVLCGLLRKSLKRSSILALGLLMKKLFLKHKTLYFLKEQIKCII